MKREEYLKNVTTREYLEREGSTVDALAKTVQERRRQHQFHVSGYSASPEDIKDLAREAGFEGTISPMRVPLLRIRLPLVNFVTLHKPEEI